MSGIHAQLTFEEILSDLNIHHSHANTIQVTVGNESGSKFSGAGVSFVDFNNDGIDDLSLPGFKSTPAQFYTLGDGTAQAVQVIPEEISKLDSKQFLWIDIDNDYDRDLFMVSHDNKSRLYINESGTWKDYTAEAGLGMDSIPATCACAGDIDNDGFIDIYVGGYFHSGSPGSNVMYRNNGNRGFESITDESGLSNANLVTLACSFIDINNNGLMDLYVSNDKSAKNKLYKNMGDATFEDISEGSGTDIKIDAMNVGYGDYDNDGYLDIYVTNGPAGNYFLRNNGDETFTDVTETTGTGLYKLCWGGSFADFDNDGWEDLFVSVSNHSSQNLKNVMYLNDRNGSFVEVDTGLELDTMGRSYGNAIGDLDEDGDYDIAVLNSVDSPSKLYRNTTTGNHYISFSLIGSKSNADAIGARIYAYAGDLEMNRLVHAGISYQSQSSFKQIFGLGQAEILDSAVIYWPAGTISKYYDLEANNHYIINESSTAIRPVEELEEVAMLESNLIRQSARINESFLPNDGKTFLIYNMYGQKISKLNTDGQGMLDCSYLESGVYILMCELEGKLYSQRFIKI